MFDGWVFLTSFELSFPVRTLIFQTERSEQWLLQVTDCWLVLHISLIKKEKLQKFTFPTAIILHYHSLSWVLRYSVQCFYRPEWGRSLEPPLYWQIIYNKCHHINPNVKYVTLKLFYNCSPPTQTFSFKFWLSRALRLHWLLSNNAWFTIASVGEKL